jgi:hypothetical protein
MFLKDSQKTKDKRRHRRLMLVAGYLLDDAVLLSRDLRGYEDITSAHVVSAAFGRYQLRIGEAEATEYLRAALVQRNYTFDHLPEPAAPAGEGEEN